MTDARPHAIPPGEEQGHQPPPQRSIGRVVFASLIGTTVEWYDFFLYGSAAALVFGPLFFPENDPATGVLLAFGTYAVGFVARPVGGLVYGHFGDRIGRKKMLVTSLLLMGAATVAIGLIPGYATIGVAAPILLIACRLLQGFAVGGEWGGAVLMAAEHSDPRRRGFWASWPQAGVPLGNLTAAAVLWLMAVVLNDQQFTQWGWRIPFLLSAALVFIGLWVRLNISESPVFTELQQDKQKHPKIPALQVIKQHPKELLLAMGMRFAENIGYYVFSVVVLTYLVNYLDAPRSLALTGVFLGSTVQFLLTPLIGALSDRVGRRLLYLIGAAGTGIWGGLIFFPLVDTENQVVITLAIVVGLMFTQLMYAPQAAFYSELFSTEVRYSGVSMASQIASVFAGGMAPLISVALLGTVDERNTTALGAYVIAAAVLTFTCAWFARETSGSSLHQDQKAA